MSTDDHLDAVFHALSDRTRRALLSQLSEGPNTISTLAAPFDMTLAAVSKHIRVLENAGLVARTITGRVHHVSLRPETLKTASRWVDEYRSYWEQTLESLARHVEE